MHRSSAVPLGTFLTFLTGASTLLGATALAQGDTWVSTKDLICVIENSDKYFAVREDPILVNLHKCPQIETSSATDLEGTTGHGGVQPPKPSSKQTSGSVGLYRSELRCIADFYMSLENKTLFKEEIINLDTLISSLGARCEN